jgi:N-acetyl-anhydromuramyl-L-alanine amidase AmpD
MKINKLKHKAPNNTIICEPQVKTQIILTDSGRFESNNILNIENKDYLPEKPYPTFTISRTGEIYQHYDVKFYTYFFSFDDYDKKSIIISLENMNWLRYDIGSDSYRNWANEICPEESVSEKEWRNYRYWEQYTKPQMTACIDLCISLCKNNNINLDTIGHNSIDAYAHNFNGIISKSNYTHEFTDVNPSFDWNLLNEKLIKTKKKLLV